MKHSFKEIMQIKDLYNLDSLPFTTVIDVLKHAYQLECALEATELSMHKWLKEIADLNAPIPEWWDYYYYLWLFKGELEYYCKYMSLKDAINEILSEWVYK